MFVAGIFLSVQPIVQVDLLSVELMARSQALLGIFIGVACLVVTPFAGQSSSVTSAGVTSESDVLS